MDTESQLNVTAKGQIKGKGYNIDDGASYAGQGGSQTLETNDFTYGYFNQVPDDTDMHVDQMGSGGGNRDKRGGGMISIIAAQGDINGDLLANGSPLTTKLAQSYHAGSGGYIYVDCSMNNSTNTTSRNDFTATGSSKKLFPCNLNNVQANGGYGSDDQVSNAGSGGRIVFRNVNISPDKYTAYGGCSNNPVALTFNGAAGTIYFMDVGLLVVKHTTKCQASSKTVLYPEIMMLDEVKNITVQKQATVTFSAGNVKSGKLEVSTNSMTFIDATLGAPIYSSGISMYYYCLFTYNFV